MLNKLLTWKIYTWFLVGVIIVFSAVLAYYTFFTSAFSGVDGGLGLAAGIIYIFIVVLFFITSQCLYLWLRHHPKIRRIYLATFWIALFLTIVGSVLYSINAAQQQAYYEEHFLNQTPSSQSSIRTFAPSINDNSGN